MRKLLALAALTLTASPALAEQPYNWSGFYAGASAGYSWGDASVTDTTGGVAPGPFDYEPSGLFGGATLGYNVQLQQIVVGVEADLGYMDLSGDGRIPSSNPEAYQKLELDGGLYGDITARLGVLVTPTTLLYAKGGWAYFDGEASQTTTNPGYKTVPTGSFSGPVYGGGIEHAINSAMTIKLEYLHFDLGTEGGNQTSVSDEPIGYVYENRTSVDADTVKVGVNFKF